MENPWHPDRILHRGAEAVVESGRWFGSPAVRKVRVPKPYRHPALDATLGRARLISELRILQRARLEGLPVPGLLDADLSRSTIVMEHLEGIPLARPPRIEGGTDALLEAVGALIRRLHRMGVVHGDLSTSNLLVDADERVSLLDFGLASTEFDVERYGIDLHVLDEVLEATHPEVEDAIDRVVDGYLALERRLGAPPPHAGGAIPGAEEVIQRLVQIRTRVRYHG